MCRECYTSRSRSTPLLNARECLCNHMQYICGSCGRCICIQTEEKRGLQRWNFPFRSIEIAKLYLRTADYKRKRACGIYEIRSGKGRVSYKIFADEEELQSYLKKNPDKRCPQDVPVFSVRNYKEYSAAKVRKLSADEAEKYLSERGETTL